ncbi:MAG: ATP synthase F1 subunit gamma [Planctomycetes bacterium]|nr:ATP synthase F1 subunit gamma [Planctomycetota bacterium]
MAKARAFDRRRKTVGNIKKITHTMQLIATARFQRSLSRTMGTKPYTEKITQLVQQVSAAGAAAEHPLVSVQNDAERHALLLITSNRGLCGGFNASLLRTAMSLVKKNDEAGVATDLYVVGKKGVNYFKFLGRELVCTYPDMPDAPDYARIEPIANSFMQSYEAKRYDKIQVIFMRFITASRQRTETIQLLPIQPEGTEQEATGATAEVQYDFTPEPAELLNELLPVTVRIRMFQCFNESVVSENVSRMVAMKSATDAAVEMIRYLSQQYNRARQAQITMELLDIMGGVEALK